MPHYRRADTPGGTYFFTVVSYRRQPFLCDPDVRAALRQAILNTRGIQPFTVEAWVLLPDHLHCIWTLPEGDADFDGRWARIKRFVTKECRAYLHRNGLMHASKERRKESTLWQRRYWEHLIRDPRDFRRHLDYLHFNPVKHGLVARVIDWPYSTFHRHLRRGVYAENWAGESIRDTGNIRFGE